ncbi:MAG TPA: hypothetical protein VHL79_06990 [Ramlibacter sp.]|jgi:hypothetical protein|nr:hypothetical protein [Ramlibacter sp.]
MRPATDNSKAYRFEDFTHEAYARLLALASRQYVFRGYDSFGPGERFVLWRHDLDFSIVDALPLARIEAEAGVRASYFVHLHCDFYNPFDARSLRAVAEIAALGHDIGLHFDFVLAGVKDAVALAARVQQEAGFLQAQYGVPVRAFSFHNPTPEALAFDAQSYGGLVNTYGAYFRTQVAYCSDSNGHWRHERLEDVLARPAAGPLQVLTHPTWWTAQVMSPREKIERTVQHLGASILADYTATLANHGRKDIDW